MIELAEQALLATAIAAPAAWRWMFSSSEAIEHLGTLAPQADWTAGIALASHPRIADRARQLGFRQVTVVAPSAEAVAAVTRAGAGEAGA